MIVQYNKKLNYTKPTDLFNYIIDTYKDEQYMKDYVLSASRTEILKDYASMKKVMITDVLPLGEKDYDKEALDTLLHNLDGNLHYIRMIAHVHYMMDKIG